MSRLFEDHWDVRFIRLAEHIAGWRKDPSTKVGCVIVGPDKEIRSTGFNGFPRGIKDDPRRLENRDEKYPLICHAEENAILQVARVGGASLRDCWVYITWPPCTRCARSIVQAGIKGVSYPQGLDVPERWWSDLEKARSMLDEAGIFVRTVAVKLKQTSSEVSIG